MKTFPTLTMHAHQRAHERFGLSFATLKRLGLLIEQASGQIKTRGNHTNNPLRDRRPPRATFAMTEGDREKWIVRDGGREIPVVYDPRDKTIVTVLPKHALRELRREANH